MTPGLASVVSLLVAGAPPGDLRLELVDLQLRDRHPAALEATETHIDRDPAAAAELGLPYLQAHLLLASSRHREALRALVQTMASTPRLSPYGRYRLALEQDRLGHPEVAAGLVATLLGQDPPRALIAPAIRLLRRTLAAGGDCRLLRGLTERQFPGEAGRLLRFSRAECALQHDQTETAVAELSALLAEESQDEVAHLAARELAQIEPLPEGARSDYLLGVSFYHHREFETAIRFLSRALARLPEAALSRKEQYECRYNLARSHFWLGRYRLAATAFGALAAHTDEPERRAQALYQQARSLELAGEWSRGARVFLLAYEAAPRGRWADGALFSFLRSHWLEGREEQALEAYRALGAMREYHTLSRAGLFLASSDLVRNRTDRADEWLRTAARLGRVERQELHYWLGRLEEAQGRTSQALDHYLQALIEAPTHPFGRAAEARLRSAPSLAAATRVRALALSASAKPSDLYAAWLWLGDDHRQGGRARQKLEAALVRDAAAAPYLRLTALAPDGWPLWQSSLRQPEEMLLALGLFGEGAPAVMRHFPVSEPDLAFTGSLLLAAAGELTRSLYIAEIMGKRIPRRLPMPLLPDSYRRLLYPIGYTEDLATQARRRSVDPHLLLAIIREESRFNPHAFSGASARGLMQFVFPTAQRVAAQYRIPLDSAKDLERPEVSIALGAAYLAELLRRFGGSVEQAIAAYNAGEAQAELWGRYCVSDEPEEYLTKIAFLQTRSYVRKVLTSRAHYAELYAMPYAPSPPFARALAPEGLRPEPPG